MSEDAKKARIKLLENSRLLSRVFVNLVGFFRGFRPNGSQFTVDAGLCKGSGDLIGWETVKITPDMVGRYVAIFKSIEVKDNANSKLQPGQQEWCDVVRAFGGIAIITHVPEEVASLVYAQSKGVARAPDMRALAPKLLLLFGGKKEKTKRRA